MKLNWLKISVELGTKKTNPEGLVFRMSRDDSPQLVARLLKSSTLGVAMKMEE